MARRLKPRGPGTSSFSDDELYRYALTRDLSAYGGRGTLMSIGLNPSTATADEDDPTVAKECRYAIAWGFAHFVKTNAYAWRDTDPAKMFAAQQRGIDIVGEDNASWLRWAIRAADQVLVAWGGKIEPARQIAIAAMLADVAPVCVKINVDGTPSHTCYAPNSAQRVPWRLPCATTS